ncbi:MAG: hypothetical protein QM791_05355 [Ferruginibacter sp.]
MKKILFASFIMIACTSAKSQFVARADIKEKIDGICDQKNIYALLPMLKGQKAATCSESDSNIEEKLNNDVTFLKDKPGYEDKGMVSIIINCNDEALRFETDNKTQSPELDEQILTVFKTFTKWKSGKLDGKKVDSIKLISFTISKGKIKLN